MLLILLRREKMSENKTMNVILVKPGCDPEICRIPDDVKLQIETISDLLEGNFASCELLDLGNGASLHLLVNDLAVPLGLAPNRTFPAPNDHEVIFGTVIFLAMGEAKNAKVQIPMHMTDEVCLQIIEQIKIAFTPCRGDEKPNPATEIYRENVGTAEERSFKWQEIACPEQIIKTLGNGKVKMVDAGENETVIEINGRYFKQVTIASGAAPIQ